MKKRCAFLVALFLAFGSPYFDGNETVAQTTANQSQAATVSGIVIDSGGEPVIGASVVVKGTTRGTITDVDGRFSLVAPVGSELAISYVGQKSQIIKVTNEKSYKITLAGGSTDLDEVVVTALGIKKDRKSLGYAIEDLNAEELMKNKSANAINSLSGKIAGVNITQSSGAAGAGSQIILRGGTSLERDNQPLFVVDGVIYDNSTSVIGNSAFDGTTATSSTNSNRVMDINPEDIENISVLKGPAAAALYGSRASAGVVIITTKKGKEGSVEVNLSAKFITSWATNLPKTQRKYKRGSYEDQYDSAGKYTGTRVNDLTYSSWGAEFGVDDKGNPDRSYNNIDDFFQGGSIWDTNLSVAGGNKNGSFYLSGSYYDQTGIIPNTGYDKATFRFNGDQKYGIFTFAANVAYSQANTDKTLTSAALYGSDGSGALQSLYTFSPSENAARYQNEDGSRYRMFGDQLDPWKEDGNPYWIVNRDKLKDNTERFTGNISIKVDITKWWWISYRVGLDSYTTENSTIIAPGGTVKLPWQKGMMSENSMRHRYLSNNVMTNLNRQFGDFNFNLMAGLATDDTRRITNYRMGWNFQVPNFYSFSNTKDTDRSFKEIKSDKRLIGVFGEFRADWKNSIFLSVTGRNDWTSTLPLENRSYFYPSVSGSVVFTEFMPKNETLSFGRVRASWAKVGKDTDPYATNTYLWPVGTFLGGLTGVGNSWTRGNPFLKPEMTESVEFGIEMRFFNNRLKFDYAYYTNNSFNQILSPRGPQSTGYIFCSMNAGDVYNKGIELSISGTPIQTKDWTWESAINLSGNRGTVENLVDGIDILYVTDVQVGNAKAASFNKGNFMAISGSKWTRTPNGKVVLDKNGMPAWDKQTTYEIGNREPKFLGGFNNTLTYKDFSFNMLWEFRVGGDVYNGTEYAMTLAGVSKFTENRDQIVINGAVETGKDADNKPIYADKSYTFKANETYEFNGTTTSGRTIINNYYKDYYMNESANFMTNVNTLRLRTVSLSYNVPKSVLSKLKVIKRAMVTVTGNNLLLFTNYNGDPEVAAAGSGSVGSSSVGIDYCGVPATASMSFGLNLTF